MRPRWTVTLTAGLLALLAPAASAAALHVIPFPGTPDASPSSVIIFSSLARGQIRSVTVTGSRSGSHRGRLKGLPARAGTEFVPQRPFAPGEHVRVSAQLTSGAAGAASGDAGAARLSFRFGVALPAERPARDSGVVSSAPAGGGPPTRSFHSAPNLHPPVVSVTHDPDRSSGDIFLTPTHSSQAGPMILNPQGQLVWFGPTSPNDDYNLQVQRYQGRPVLTWWEGGLGGNVILNSSYQQLALVRAGNGYEPDAHDFEIAPHGTAWLTAVDKVTADLTPVGGPSNGTLFDSVIQKVDIRTGAVLWEWHAYGHIPLKATYRRASDHLDAYHLNSLQLLPDGNLLVSVRNTWAVYEINTTTGQIVWTLGGKRNQFRRGPGTGFAWQHDARLHGSTLTVFDDADAPQHEQQSSAKELKLRFAPRTVKLIRRYTHAPPLLASAQGSARLLANGNMFVGWGTAPDFSEYNARGRQIFTGSFALGVTSYRALRFPWTGHPDAPPAIAVTTGRKGSVKVWASWNGATNVATWRVLGGGCRSALTPVARVRRTSFETRITLNHRPACVEAQALNRRGRVLGTSSAEPVAR